MYDKLTLLQMATQSMNWIAKRQEVLSENIANADTPNFIPSDLKPPDFKTVLGESAGMAPVKLAVTDPKHIQPGTGSDANPKVFSQRKTYESSPDGNAVILEEQMAKMGEAQTKYDTAINLMQKHIRMLRTAIGKNSA
jgi:flagellar basal-body rod protein FlgB